MGFFLFLRNALAFWLGCKHKDYVFLFFKIQPFIQNCEVFHFLSYNKLLESRPFVSPTSWHSTFFCVVSLFWKTRHKKGEKGRQNGNRNKIGSDSGHCITLQIHVSVCLHTLNTKEFTSDWTFSNPVINLPTKNEATKTASGSDLKSISHTRTIASWASSTGGNAVSKTDLPHHVFWRRSQGRSTRESSPKRQQ